MKIFYIALCAILGLSSATIAEAQDFRVAEKSRKTVTEHATRATPQNPTETKVTIVEVDSYKTKEAARLELELAKLQAKVAIEQAKASAKAMQKAAEAARDANKISFWDCMRIGTCQNSGSYSGGGYYGGGGGYAAPYRHP